MLAGVASGIAGYLHVDVVLVRIAMVVAVFVGGVGIPLYLAGWLLMPDETAAESVAGGFVTSMSDWRH
jgi:phage shock protein PspC (stress-responsive transcriptional regulator)